MVDESFSKLYAHFAVALDGSNGHVPMDRAIDAKDRVVSRANVGSQAVMSDMLPLYAAVAHVADKVAEVAAVDVT